MPSRTPSQRLTIWTVGCPHCGDLPDATLPEDVRLRAGQAGLACEFRAFPATGFHLAIADPAGRPDIIVIDNYGVLTGTTTDLGTFIGIHAVISAADLVPVTGSLDTLLRPSRGWVYLVKGSPGYTAARALAAHRPPVPESWPDSNRSDETVRSLAREAAVAFLNGRADRLWPLLDPEHMVLRTETAEPGDERSDLDVARVWGNARLAFCGVTFRWPERAGTLGGGWLAVALRRGDNDRWGVLLVSTDPVTVGHLGGAIPALATGLTDGDAAPVCPVEVTAPPDGESPGPRPDDVDDDRFGYFTWRRAPGAVAEVAEFASEGDEISTSRVLVLRRDMDQPEGQCSAGELWSTGYRWVWRVWSVGADGRVAFSPRRAFDH